MEMEVDVDVVCVDLVHVVHVDLALDLHRLEVFLWGTSDQAFVLYRRNRKDNKRIRHIR